MSKKLIGAVGVALVLLSQPLQAQMPGFDIRVGAHTAMPAGDLENGYDHGYGAYLRLGGPTGAMSPMSLMGGLTWTRFVPKSGLFNDRDFLNAQLGPHFMVVPGLDLGIEGVYYTEGQQFGFSPVISAGIPNLEATLSYTSTFSGSRTNWFALGVGIKF